MIYSFSGKYRYLSNFWLCPVILDDTVYASVENAYQAAKCDVKDDRLLFVSSSPGLAKRLGQEVKQLEVWPNIKLEVMNRLVSQKFKIGTYNSHLLDQTGLLEIVEGNTWGDTFWGVCNGIGENHLGKILMDIRAKNRN